MATTITPVFIPTEKNCILVENKKYCEDKAITPKYAGIIIFMCVIFIMWAITPMFIDNYYRRIGGLFFALWYVLPPLILATILYFI